MKLSDLWLKYPKLDLIPVLLGPLALLLPFTKAEEVNAFTGGIAGLGGVLLGVASLAFTVYQTSTGTRMAQVRQKAGHQSTANWASILLGLVAGCAATAISFAVAVASVPLAVTITALAGLLILSKAFRLAHLLVSCLTIAELDAVEEAGPVRARSDLGTR